MSEEMKMLKFKKLIENVQNAIHKNVHDEHSSIYISSAKRYLETIYHYDKLNDFGKIIMDTSKIMSVSTIDKYINYSGNILDLSEQIVDKFKYKYYGYGFICKVDFETAGYTFIFWALMILAVDDTDKEEHLSTICDFATMLGIDATEMTDMINLIKYIFKYEKYEPLKTRSIKACFDSVLCI